MIRLKDQLNRELKLNTIPKRIVSLVPSQTELLVDLGLENSIVGVTKFCVHPINLRKQKTIVGGTKQVHYDKIKALEPDIILCNKEENTKEIVEACEQICNVHVSDIFNINDNLELINQYGLLFNKSEDASRIIKDIQLKCANFKSFIEEKPTLKVVYFIWKNPWMVAGNNTFINYILHFNKFENVYNSKARYPEIELNKSELNESVEVVLLSSEPFPFKEKHVAELQDYYPKAKIVLVDGELFSWYGSRLAKAFKYFETLRLSF